MSGIQFGNYQDYFTYHKQLAKRTNKYLVSKDADDFYNHVMMEAMKTSDRGLTIMAHTERKWWKANRPYYNVWPAMLDALLSFKIEKVPISNLATPRISTIELRFPSHAISGVESVLVEVTEREDETGFLFFIGTDIRRDNGSQPLHRAATAFPKGSNQKASVILQRFCNDGEEVSKLLLPAIRCSLSVILMQDDPNAIEPDVLASDRDKWVDATEDEKARIEAKAVRRRGRLGFHVGRACETSPHWRNPHLALFWTGKGRTTPKVQMRSGCLVKKKSMKDVPTGYRGIE